MRAPNYHWFVTTAPLSRSDLDPFRLPRHVVPRRYEVHLEPDLADATFSGRVLIEATVEATTRLIALNAKELEISSVHVDGAIAVHALDVESERLVIGTSQDVPTGTTMIDISFTGRLNDKLRGFYRSTFGVTTARNT